MKDKLENAAYYLAIAFSVGLLTLWIISLIYQALGHIGIIHLR